MTELSNGDLEVHLEAFQRGTVDLIERSQLVRLLDESLRIDRPLRVKFGMDPSSPDLHLGHAVQLMKLRDLQLLGHRILLIVGDFTAMIGDPSGRNKLRPQLAREEIERNLETYKAQAGAVLDMDRTEVWNNSEWFARMGFEDVLKLAGRMTVARMIERDTFQERMKTKEPIGIHEFLYPLAQGWDSVQIHCDAELGGSDQLFNLLVGRQLQEQEQQAPQVCFTLPLINGLDGRKMSKSYDNAIGLQDEPEEMFGKVMSIEDGVMESWFTLLTRLPQEEIAALLAGHPRRAKARLAQEITAFFHGLPAARAASEAFDRQFKDGELPERIPERGWPGAERELPLANLLHLLEMVPSTSEARRVVQQGGVRLDGEVCPDPTAAVQRPRGELLVQIGKRRYVLVRGQEESTS